MERCPSVPATLHRRDPGLNSRQPPLKVSRDEVSEDLEENTGPFCQVSGPLTSGRTFLAIISICGTKLEAPISSTNQALQVGLVFFCQLLPAARKSALRFTHKSNFESQVIITRYSSTCAIREAQAAAAKLRQPLQKYHQGCQGKSI